jgi:N-methylhydantoinase A
MRYRGQSFELEIAATGDVITAFHRAHRERYGHSDTNRVVEIVSVRLRGIGRTEKPAIKSAGRLNRVVAVPRRSSLIWLGEKRSRVSVYDRTELKAGAVIKSPAIIVEYGSTTLVPPAWGASVDRRYNLVLDRVDSLT